ERALTRTLQPVAARAARRATLGEQPNSCRRRACDGGRPPAAAGSRRAHRRAASRPCRSGPCNWLDHWIIERDAPRASVPAAGAASAASGRRGAASRRDPRRALRGGSAPAARARARGGVPGEPHVGARGDQGPRGSRPRARAPGRRRDRAAARGRLVERAPGDGPPRRSPRRRSPRRAGRGHDAAPPRDGAARDRAPRAAAGERAPPPARRRRRRLAPARGARGRAARHPRPPLRHDRQPRVADARAEDPIVPGRGRAARDALAPSRRARPARAGDRRLPRGARRGPARGRRPRAPSRHPARRRAHAPGAARAARVRPSGGAPPEESMSDFRLETTTQEPGLETAMKVVYQWDYDPQVEELRRLYVKAAEAQWISERDVDWDRDIDLELFATTPLGSPLPIEKTSYWKSLTAEQVQEVTRKTAAFRLSNFLHGEQGALIVASQLVNAVPHTDAKFYAATQTMDEARHVEVFARYIQKLDEIRPIAPPLKAVLDETLKTDDWLKKLVGMQIVVEGLALYSFREMRNLTEEPLLKELLTYVARDESRHHAYGVQY